MSAARRAFLVLAAVIVALIALPYLIAPFYRVVNPVSTPMIWRWATGGRIERTFLPIGAIAPTLPLTVILAEDASFCRNHGIDLSGVREALQQADDDIAEARGGSTITQQTAKNLFLWQGRSFVRKALEIPLAIWINLVLPKRRVLEIYLNIVEWGPRGQFGAEAAARWAFGKSARDLTAQQSAELAAILPNPFRRSARTPSALVRQLARVYENRAASFPTHDACIRGRTH